ncbi:hypothetical protein [Clostridium gasigenes]|uniref:Uncharacterized protein n=1 Tax=Clostridium gasigenes TaxID=94869 RepID=A0A7X0SAA8_9CLOT|nr:hypothetical protein [Clostridium gasigenes]MBB6713890.1 hypothetical protein [Clostridium gasigenes]
MGLLLEKTEFELDIQTKDSAFFVSPGDDRDGLQYSIECSFKNKEFEGANVSPALIINWIETNVKKFENLVNLNFEVETVEEADKREDTFYVVEHEPLENYKLTVLEIQNDKAHIKCIGTAIIDGYSVPYTTGEFEIDCWLPIITNQNDWAKFDL